MVDLNVAPDFDEATHYSYRWNRALIDELGTDPIELLGIEATRQNFEEAINEANIETMIFYDHGSETGLVADGAHEYLLDKNNDKLVAGKYVYTMCCLAAKDLGADAYRKGAKAWWGYTEEFSFMPQNEQVYQRLSNLGLILIKKQNMSYMSAWAEVVTEFDREIEAATDPWTEMTLINDRDALVVWCDDNQPSTQCMFRKMGIDLFGKAGHHISRMFAVYVLVGGIGYTGTVYSILAASMRNHLLFDTMLLGLTGSAMLGLGMLGVAHEYLDWLSH